MSLAFNTYNLFLDHTAVALPHTCWSVYSVATLPQSRHSSPDTGVVRVVSVSVIVKRRLINKSPLQLQQVQASGVT